MAKSIYVALTVLIGARTLGEEYVDLIHVHRSGKKLPRIFQRLGFVVSYALIPYIISRLVKRLIKNEGPIGKFLGSYHKVLDTILNAHIAVFYFQGEFYSLAKRFFGLRYAFGHNKDPNKLNISGNYSFLGGIILVQFLVKGLILLRGYTEKEKKGEIKGGIRGTIGDIDQLKKLQNVESEIGEDHDSKDGVNDEKQTDLKTLLIIDLEDPTMLPYIPSNSRSCMLCLSPMTNPSAANCGHLFCWDCIVDWLREHPECPLCRQQCLEQNLLPLR